MLHVFSNFALLNLDKINANIPKERHYCRQCEEITYVKKPAVSKNKYAIDYTIRIHQSL